MKRPVLTAVLLLLHLLSLPQVSTSPPFRVHPISLEAVVDASSGYKNGSLNGRISIGRQPDAGTKMSVTVTVAGAKPGMSVRKIYPVKDTLVSFTLSVTNLRLWSAETPVLYDVKVRLTDTSGHVLDSGKWQCAFRDIAVRNGRLYCNGRPVWIKGMDQRWLDAATRVPHSVRSMDQTIRWAKTYNINAVRPMPADNEYWRTQCDLYGIYVVDEAGGPLVDPASGFKDRWDTIRSRAEKESNAGTFVPFLIGPDGAPVAAAAEVRKVYQPVLTTVVNGTGSTPGVTLRIYNDHSFQDLSYLSMEWQMLVNGVPGQHGTAPLPPTGPQKASQVHLPLRLPAAGEVLLNVVYRQKKAGLARQAGDPVASEQLTLRENNINDISVHPAGELTFKDEGGSFGISSPVTGLDMQFDKQTGWLRHYSVGNRSLLQDTTGLTAGFLRWTSGPDTANGQTAWENAGHNARLQLFSTSTSNDFVIVRADYLLPETGCLLHFHYTVNARGEIQVEDILEIDTANTTGTDTNTLAVKPRLPGMGMLWVLPPGYDSVVYYGRGPQDNYIDRRYAADAGIYRELVDSEGRGARTDVRWWKVTDKQGHGIRITSDSSLLIMRSSHVRDMDLKPGPQIRPEVLLHIDHWQMGIRGKGLPYGNYHYIYKVTPL